MLYLKSEFATARLLGLLLVKLFRGFLCCLLKQCIFWVTLCCELPKICCQHLRVLCTWCSEVTDTRVGKGKKKKEGTCIAKGQCMLLRQESQRFRKKQSFRNCLMLWMELAGKVMREWCCIRKPEVSSQSIPILSTVRAFYTVVKPFIHVQM